MDLCSTGARGAAERKRVHELETIKRVFKLLAVRVHPDNPATGDAEQLHKLTEAYETLSRQLHAGPPTASYGDVGV
jgi:hypothetical protein